MVSWRRLKNIYDHLCTFSVLRIMFGQEYLNSPSKQYSIQKFTHFNIILYIEVFHVIIGYVTLRLKIVKPATNVTKLMELCISLKIAIRLISSGLTGLIGGNISMA